jgi:HEPN domain-containing protein
MTQETKEWYDKAIKALIIFYGAEGGIPKLHDLSFLLNQIKNKVDIEEKYYDYADTLSPYGVAVRYPNELFLEERHAKEAVQLADEILQWVNHIIEDTAS